MAIPGTYPTDPKRVPMEDLANIMSGDEESPGEDLYLFQQVLHDIKRQGFFKILLDISEKIMLDFFIKCM